MGCEKRPITDWWPRERKAVFNSMHSREAKRNTNGKSEEEKTAAGLQDNADNRFDRRGRFNRNENLSGYRANN
jgi:hypothetical protein